MHILHLRLPDVAYKVRHFNFYLILSAGASRSSVCYQFNNTFPDGCRLTTLISSGMLDKERTHLRDQTPTTVKNRPPLPLPPTLVA